MKRIALIAWVTFVTSGACTKTGLRDAPGEIAKSADTVRVAPAHLQAFATLYRASGTVRGRRTTVLTSKTTGYVRTIRAQPGDVVRSGQPLVELEANDARASVARARAELAQSAESKTEEENALQAARAAARIASTSFDRMKVLFADEAVSRQQFDEAEASRQSAEAQERAAEARVRAVTSRIAEAEAGVDEASAALAYADIVAPFDGRVIERRVDPGALAGPGTPLLVVADEGKLRVEAAVEESRAPSIHLGDQAEVQLDATSRLVAATVAEIVPNVDVASRALLVKLELPTEMGNLHAGSFARVEFHAGTSLRLVVPTSAITRLGALDRVFVADAKRARLRLVTLGETRGEWIEVLSGLSEGERVVSSPPADLRDGEVIEEQL